MCGIRIVCTNKITLPYLYGKEFGKKGERRFFCQENFMHGMKCKKKVHCQGSKRHSFNNLNNILIYHTF